MTELSELPQEAQAVLYRTPTSVAMAAAYAEQDGVFSLPKELKAGLQGAIEAATAFPDNLIVQALALNMNSSDESLEADVREYEAKHPDEIVEERSPTKSRGAALELAAESMAIMHEHATPEETIEFKYWLYTIADQVTIASKAGGFLGFGGVQVSGAEQTFLEDLKNAIGME